MHLLITRGDNGRTDRLSIGSLEQAASSWRELGYINGSGPRSKDVSNSQKFLPAWESFTRTPYSDNIKMKYSLIH